MRGGGGTERWPTAVLWGLLTALCAGATVLAVLVGLAYVAPGGPAVRVAVTACTTRDTGKNSYVRCEGVRPDGTTVVLPGRQHPGRTVEAVRAPWGDYIAPRTSPLARSAAFAAPLLLLLAAVACGLATLRSVRRARRRSTAGLLAPVRLG
ncbi:hypothetical protein [Streptomyces sp. NPDC008125]|uniref:hypothetical protein n=1 Tax=Streptomyces sp. NPDC008125 TaxID=3364811 RepID=UPI0036EA2A1C